MKVLVTGSRGQIGQDVVSLFSEAGHHVIACGRRELDITNMEHCQQVISVHQPEVIIHCASYTAVDAAETNVDEAYLVNATGTGNMALSAERVGAKLVYISTDYVFNGQSPHPYYEYDRPDPQSIYGKTKRAGECLVQGLCSQWFIVRTSWVFGRHGQNFVKTMLRLGQERELLQVVNDQKGSPTYTVDLVHFLLELTATEKYGIYHASNSGACTWYEFAKAIFEKAQELLGVSFKARLEPCRTDEFPRAAPRPENSVLGHLAIRNNQFDEFRHWSEALEEFLPSMRHSL
ncbi:dTDP-4-dehydrorhamnose reductase [Paenibacillus faecalis]|uniref:dTDP-4-dehydrorhamnose reductase n=1 Tax=Paenibacillus faecalis TaxID=2079532 RepID=UPI000D0F4B14|nr:dTDP-4-dehydrorhamnose reductase [Paenibacillus faecalis]